MLDHCDECGTDFAFGLSMCPNCQTPNTRLVEVSEETPPAPPVEDEVPAPRRTPPTGKKPDLPDDAPKIHPK
jgi:uncharacterized Zn finger protein (UPF0148 family)